LFVPHIKVRGAWNKRKLLKGGAVEKRLRTTVGWWFSRRNFRNAAANNI